MVDRIFLFFADKDVTYTHLCFLQEDEARLLKEVFVQIRSGHLEHAQQLCMHTGQHWRAAALEGWRLHHDPNYETARGIEEVDKLPVQGNPNRYSLFIIGVLFSG